MGHCCSKAAAVVKDDATAAADIVSSPSPIPAPIVSDPAAPCPSGRPSPSPSSAQSPWMSPFPSGIGIGPSPARTPMLKLKWPFPPPSPAKPIMAAIRRWQGKAREGTAAAVAEEGTDGTEREGEGTRGLDKEFGFGRNFAAKYEVGKEVGRGHFGHTRLAKAKKGEIKGETVAVKIISKAKMTSAIAVEDVRREVKMLKALSGNAHMLKFYEAFEDAENVYMVMELCEGGELLDRILSRGGRYTEEDAKAIVTQILNAVAFCHFQGIVHRDLKPENFLFTTKEEDSPMKIIDFGLSDFVRPDQRLNDVVGSAYYVAPEVLHRSYNVEADMWSIGVITYILLCGSRPFWARTESGIFRSVLRAEPNFDDAPWPTISPEAKDFVKRLLNKDHRKRMTAVQALTHPWLRDESRPLPLDIFVYKLVKTYVRATPLRRAALKALSKALTEDELVYLKAQFRILEPKDGLITLENFKTALHKHAADAMRTARVSEILTSMEPLSNKKLDFDEFCAAATSIYQLEALESWDKIATAAFQHFEQEGNRVISIGELVQEMSLGPNAYALVKDWIRISDGKVSFLGYTKFLHGVTIRNTNTGRR
ncbi:CDPK-related kinase 4-like protein [Drosera capensis]